MADFDVWLAHSCVAAINFRRIELCAILVRMESFSSVRGAIFEDFLLLPCCTCVFEEAYVGVS